MANEPLLSVDDHLCFALYACSREITKLYRPFLDEHGLTYPQYLVLVVLHEHGECTVKSLGESLFLDSGTLTPLLKRMQEAGLVTRRRGTDDERKVVVALTKTGQQLRVAAANVPYCLAGSAGIEDEQWYLRMLADLRQLLTKVHTAHVESV